MSQQKSHKNYISVPVGMKLSEAPLPKTENLEECVWFTTKECQKSGLRQHVKKEPYNGIGCKCFAYCPNNLINKPAGDYQI